MIIVIDHMTASKLKFELNARPLDAYLERNLRWVIRSRVSGGTLSIPTIEASEPQSLVWWLVW